MKTITVIVKNLTREQIENKIRNIAEREFGPMSAYSYHKDGEVVYLTEENHYD